jgi:hypothetical protein
VPSCTRAGYKFGFKKKKKKTPPILIVPPPPPVLTIAPLDRAFPSTRNDHCYITWGSSITQRLLRPNSDFIPFSDNRILWGAASKCRCSSYEPESNALSVKNSPPAVSLPSHDPVSSKKARLVNKDMVSNPTGFMYVHDHYTSTSLSLKSNQPFSACI